MINDTQASYFVGAHYEVADGVLTKYYYAGTQRIAMRTNGTLNFLLGDHLGSTSLTTNASGNPVSELRYKAWGEVRFASDTTPTKYTYTGQYSYTGDPSTGSGQGFGLMYYGARWYDPSLGRFNQPDTIIPEQSQGVQAWDRYAYTNNNPVRYNDPSGHCIGFAKCFWEIVDSGLFLANRAISNGGLSNQDFVDAANGVAPAVASGSKESVSFFVSEMVAYVGSTTLITTADGQSQVFTETDMDKNGIPEGGAVIGAGLSATHGYVFGLEESKDPVTGQTVYNPSRYAGGATQGNISIPYCAFCGGYFEGYKADEGSPVWGIDAGGEIGFGPTILAAAHTTAEPTNKVLWILPVNLLNRTGKNRLSGPELLVCRIASMCGAQ